MPIKSKYFLLFIILFSTIIISGCSTILFGPSGSIEVTTNPSGAKIFLDSKNTGKITPYTVKNVSAGNHIIEVTFSDMKYTEIAEVKAYQTTSIYIEFYSQITLDKINVLPSYTTITLSLGSTVKINKATAYYSDYSSASIPLANCTYSSNDACATVNSSGTITGILAGAAIITVSYTEGGITKTDTILVYIRNTPTDTPITPPVQDDIIYRALLVGVGDYENLPDYYPDAAETTDLVSPPYDVGRMYYILDQCRFGSSNTKFFIINDELKDLYAKKDAIFEGIASTFIDADDNDISYFYFTGHGSWDLNSISYICPADANDTVDSLISIDELETELSKIHGTKVIFLDSCHSGGFIGKGKRKDYFDRDSLAAFNNNVINIFSISQSKNLANNQYKVLTSCHIFQTCLSMVDLVNPENSYGLFTTALCSGCGYFGTYPADTNMDTKVSLQEAYSYVESSLELYEQDVQVYPTNSTFTIVEY